MTIPWSRKIKSPKKTGTVSKKEIREAILKVRKENTMTMENQGQSQSRESTVYQEAWNLLGDKIERTFESSQSKRSITKQELIDLRKDTLIEVMQRHI